MKPGDLVRRKGTEWLALVLEVRGSFVRIMWNDAVVGDIDGCSASLMEVISEISD